MMGQTTTLGQIAYAAYGESVSWKNYQGLPMPQWDDLTDAIRRAWEKSAEAIQVEMALRVLSGSAHYIARDS